MVTSRDRRTGARRVFSVAALFASAPTPADAACDILVAGPSGTVTNATSQQHRTTVISYGPGRHAQAEAVARALSLGAAALAPLDASSRVVARGAGIVVTVGADASR